MIVEEKLAPEFQIKLVVEQLDPFQYGSGLFLYLLLIIEANGTSHSLLPFVCRILTYFSLLSMNKSICMPLFYINNMHQNSNNQSLIVPCEETSFLSLSALDIIQHENYIIRNQLKRTDS